MYLFLRFCSLLSSSHSQDGDRKSGNVQAGFVASEGIANPIAKDFYLLSHGGILGSWCTICAAIFKLTDHARVW
jgi:hypothetical protein